MYWTCNINKLKAQIAKEDINVYKIVKKATQWLYIDDLLPKKGD